MYHSDIFTACWYAPWLKLVLFWWHCGRVNTIGSSRNSRKWVGKVGSELWAYQHYCNTLVKSALSECSNSKRQCLSGKHGCRETMFVLFSSAFSNTLYERLQICLQNWRIYKCFHTGCLECIVNETKKTPQGLCEGINEKLYNLSTC